MPGGLITGSPIGNIVTQEDLYIEGAPFIFIQDATANPLNNPDADGYYWNMTGSTAYPVHMLGCVLDVSMTEGLTMNDVRCDTIGVVGTIQRRDYVEFQLTIQSLLPLSTLAIMMNLSTATVGSGKEKVGIGGINSNKKFMVYMPKVYDEDTGDYLVFHLHKASFVDAWTINMASGEPWKVTGIKLRAYADSTKPSTMKFGTLARFDQSALP
jgi:hypothetical protein